MWQKLVLMWAGVFVVLPLTSWVFPIARNPAALLVLLFFVVGIWIASVVDIARGALQTTVDDARRTCSWWMVIGYVFSLGLASSVLESRKSDWLGYRLFRMPRSTMEPSIKMGEMFAVDIHAYQNVPISKGDVVVVTDSSSSQHFVRRVSRVEADRIFIEVDNKAWVGDADKGSVPFGDLFGKVTYIAYSSDLSRMGDLVK